MIEAATGKWLAQLRLKQGETESGAEGFRQRPRETTSWLGLADTFRQRSLRRMSVREYIVGLDEIIPLFDRLALIFAVIGKHDAISILLLRAIDDFQVAIFCGLCQMQGELIELMRDVLEIELLIREFRHAPQRMEEWLTADPSLRKNDFSANTLRQRHANRVGVKPQDLPDASDYRMHSQALHISPVSEAPPFKLRGINICDDPFAVDMSFLEILHHAESLFKTTKEFSSSLSGKTESFEDSLKKFSHAHSLAQTIGDLYHGIVHALKGQLGSVSAGDKELEAEIRPSELLAKYASAFESLCSGSQLWANCKLIAAQTP